MPAEQLPSQFPGLITRESRDIEELNRNLKALTRSIEDLRRILVQVINAHALDIDDHETRITALEP